MLKLSRLLKNFCVLALFSNYGKTENETAIEKRVTNISAINVFRYYFTKKRKNYFEVSHYSNTYTALVLSSNRDKTRTRNRCHGERNAVAQGHCLPHIESDLIHAA